MTTTENTVTTESATSSDELSIQPEVRASLVRGTATEVSIRAGEHTFTVDEPAGLGGSDLGANPVEHLLAALGACQVITYQVWAEKLGLRLDGVDISLAGDLDLRGFFGLDDVRPGFRGIEAQVQLTGPESDERYHELARVVEDHCPVLDNIAATVPVTATVTTV